MDAQFVIRDRTTVVRELAVKVPLDWKNFGFIVHQLGQRLEEANRAQYDDACEVSVGDDEIIFSWTVSEETTDG